MVQQLFSTELYTAVDMLLVSSFRFSPPLLPSPSVPFHSLPLFPTGSSATEGGAKYGVRELRGDAKTQQAEEAHPPAQVRICCEHFRNTVTHAAYGQRTFFK